MAFFGLGNNNDVKQDQAVVAQLQALTSAQIGLQAIVTGLRNNIGVLIGRINLLMGIDTDLQNEVAAENLDIQKLLTAQNQEIADFKTYLGSQPPIASDVQVRLVTLLSNIQAAHQTVIAATTTVQAADPGTAPVPTVNS